MKGKLPRMKFRSERGRTPSVQSLIVIFVLLFVLFLWLNFLLAQQTESVGRDLQVKTNELQSLEREGDALRKAIAIKASQHKMAERARVLGYQPQAPFFLPMSEPLIEPAAEAPAGQTTTLASSEGDDAAASSKLLLLLTSPFLGPESETAP